MTGSRAVLAGVLDEVAAWTTHGVSRFGRLLNTSGLAPPVPSPLANLLPAPTN